MSGKQKNVPEKIAQEAYGLAYSPSPTVIRQKCVVEGRIGNITIAKCLQTVYQCDENGVAADTWVYAITFAYRDEKILWHHNTGQLHEMTIVDERIRLHNRWAKPSTDKRDKTYYLDPETGEATYEEEAP